MLVKTRRFVNVIFIKRDFGQPSVDALWDVFDDARWVVIFLIDVEGNVTRFGVNEVYHFLVGLDSNPQTVLSENATQFLYELSLPGGCLGYASTVISVQAKVACITKLLFYVVGEVSAHKFA